MKSWPARTRKPWRCHRLKCDRSGVKTKTPLSEIWWDSLTRIPGSPRESISGIRESAETGQEFLKIFFAEKSCYPACRERKGAEGAMIEVKNLRKVFRIHQKPPGLLASIRSLFHRQYVDKVAVAGADFSVGEGEIVGMIGANGAGKTTLVKMLSGIVHPTSGEARVLGYNPWEKHNDLRRQISLIMGQKAQLWWDLPGADCFELLREIYQIPRPEYESNLERLTEMLQVEDELNTQIRRLSLGERMKMELIAALLHSPRVVYLDEPTIGLDITTQKAVRDFLLSYRQDHAPAMILTSHYMEDIERLCERIIIIREGELVYDGNLQRVIHEYAPYKQLTVHLNRAETAEVDKDYLDRIGEVMKEQAGTIVLRIPRNQVASAAAEILRKFSVQDLSIADPEISEIIELIMGGKEKPQT